MGNCIEQASWLSGIYPPLPIHYWPRSTSCSINSSEFANCMCPGQQVLKPRKSSRKTAEFPVRRYLYRILSEINTTEIKVGQPLMIKEAALCFTGDRVFGKGKEEDFSPGKLANTIPQEKPESNVLISCSQQYILMILKVQQSPLAPNFSCLSLIFYIQVKEPSASNESIIDQNCFKCQIHIPKMKTNQTKAQRKYVYVGLTL